MNAPKFNIEKIMQSYQFSSDREDDISQLLSKSDFQNNKETFALIGIGGTISSGYSPAQETIIPGSYKVSYNLMTDLQNKFRINNDKFTTVDLFSKDSRDIEDADIVQLLDTLNTIDNERILITCGTYMLPRVTSMIATLRQFPDKIIGVTGSMIPNGFGFSDASMNILSAVTIVNYYAANKDNMSGNNAFTVFHGEVYDTEKKLQELDLHPKEIENLIVEYPLSSTPYNFEEEN